MAIEIVFNIIIGLGIVFYLYNATQLPTTDNPADVFGAGGFPEIIGSLALAVLVLITIKVIKEKRPIDIPMFRLGRPEGRMLVTNVILLAAYIALLNVLGFALSTALYLFVAAASIGYRKWGLLTLFSIVASAMLVGIFGTVFYVPLPRGIEFFRELSYFIY
jgi:putative tricarboxylic transport membrane protein